jgi:hypothetical protein
MNYPRSLHRNYLSQAGSLRILADNGLTYWQMRPYLLDMIGSQKIGRRRWTKVSS